jgi:hypothetical protein
MHVLDSAWETLKREFESASLERQLKARQQITGELNRIFRRFRNYENEEEWLSALRDGAALCVSGFAIFTVSDGELELRSSYGLPVANGLRIRPETAAAFGSAMESREPLVTLRRPSEVGDALASEEASTRAHLFPISNSGRAVALVFAAGEAEIDSDGLELITGMASAVLERRVNQTLHTQIAAPFGAPPLPAPPDDQGPAVEALPAWADLNEMDRRLHGRAQRFARVAVAEMQLARPEACRSGREQSNLYLFLQAEIDKARESYARQFMTISSMVDYLHLELLQVAADGDEKKLGADYPGHLV